MKILEINYTDLPGHIFNGYDLHLNLRHRGYDADMIVKLKKSHLNTVHQFNIDIIMHQQLIEFEKKYSVSNVIFPYAFNLEQQKEFQEADIVHYHILHNQTISLIDYPRLMNQKPSVWTIHDPWIITGNCIHPLNCLKWRTGCSKCSDFRRDTFKMEQDNTEFMWNLKKGVLKQINPYVVVSSDFMKDYLQSSPLTNHFDKIQVIPFGIDIDKYNPLIKKRRKQEYGIDSNKIVIGFRSSDDLIKGCQYLYDALEQLDDSQDIALLCVGGGSVPEKIKQKYETTELGWVQQEQRMISYMEACDIFIMPSLAESFGLMSIESMAAGCTFICFQNTVLEEMVRESECGIAVEYQSSKAIANAIKELTLYPKELEQKGILGRKFVKQKYPFHKYVDSHIRLYEKILAENR